MKRIYLLMATCVGLATTATAQRHPDVTVQHYYMLGTGAATTEIVDNTHILFDADKNYQINYGLKINNLATNAADSVAMTDTIRIKTPLFNFRDRFSIAAGSSFGPYGVSSFPQAIIPGTDPGQPWDDFVSKPVTVNWCDSIWIYSAAGSTDPVDELVTNNNKTCNSVIIDGWMTGVDEVKISGNGLMVYPNPSTGSLTALFDFGNNNSGVITITDVTGKTVYTQQLNNVKGLQSVKINATGLANGLYSLRLAAGSKIAVERIYINN
jgi:hypothetical protein